MSAQSDAMDRLTASLTAFETVETGVIEQNTKLAALVRANASNPAAILAIADKLDADAATAAANIAANTDAAG